MEFPTSKEGADTSCEHLYWLYALVPTGPNMYSEKSSLLEESLVLTVLQELASEELKIDEFSLDESKVGTLYVE